MIRRCWHCGKSNRTKLRKAARSRCRKCGGRLLLEIDVPDWAARVQVAAIRGTRAGRRFAEAMRRASA